MKIKTFVIIVLLCAILSMGCLGDSVETVETVETVEDEMLINESTLEPAKLVIKSIKVEDEGIVTKIKNVGESPAENIYFAMIGVDFHPSYDEGLKWNYSISNDTCIELIDGVIRDNDFSLNTSFYGRYTKKRIPGEYINVSGEPLHLKPNLYKDYLGVIKPGEVVESNMFLYWDHERYIKVLYNDEYNIYEYTLYDNFDGRMGNLKSILA